MPYPYLLRANKRILIELAPKTLTLFASDEPLFSSPIAIGKSQTPTPIGEWKVINKKILDPRSVSAPAGSVSLYPATVSTALIIL